MIRVLHVIPSLGPARGGPSVAARLMASAVARRGWPVDVVTTNDNDRTLLDVPLSVPIEEDGVTFRYFPRNARPYTISFGLRAWLHHHVTDYDVVHVHALFSFTSTVAARCALRRRVPYILRPLGTLAPYGMRQHPRLKAISWRLIEHDALTHAAAVHFTSTAERDEAARLGGNWQAVVVPIGLEFGVTNHDTKDRPLTFLFLSRIDPKKRVEVVLRALAGLDGTRLVVAGDGDPRYLESLRRLARELGVAERVIWTGYVGGDAKRSIMAAADVFVLPSINENFGIAVVEALGAGLPVIVSRGVAIHHEIQQAGAGLVADGSVESIATAMRAMTSAAARTAMAEAARGLAMRCYTMDAMADGLMNLYERSAGK